MIDSGSARIGQEFIPMKWNFDENANSHWHIDNGPNIRWEMKPTHVRHLRIENLIGVTRNRVWK